MNNSQISKLIETLLTEVKEMWDNRETPHAQIIGYMEGYLKTIKNELDQEDDSWKLVSEKTPPINVELLVKSPEDIVHLSSWRESYNIFSCQEKSESSSNWKWKTI